MTSMTQALRLLAAMALFAICASPALSADGANQRSGTTLLGEWSDGIKTDAGKVRRHYKVVYDWDTGLTHRQEFDDRGVLISTTTRRAAPAPSPAEIEQAKAIVNADLGVQQMRRQQGGLGLDGGFAMRNKPGEGPCTQTTRCVQMFLFDGENVVRHMLVDLRSSRILNADYIPPRNKRTAQ